MHGSTSYKEPVHSWIQKHQGLDRLHLDFAGPVMGKCSSYSINITQNGLMFSHYLILHLKLQLIVSGIFLGLTGNSGTCGLKSLLTNEVPLSITITWCNCNG